MWFGCVFGFYLLKGSLMKKLMMVVVVFCLLVGVFVQSSVIIYGSFDVGVVYINNFNGGLVLCLDQGMMQLDCIGFCGIEDLGGNLKVIFQLEVGFYIDSGVIFNLFKLFNCYSIIGLLGDFGVVILGYMFDVVFDYVGKLFNGFQLINWYLFYLGNLDSLVNIYQFDNVVCYIFLILGGFQGSLMYGFGEVVGDSSNGCNVSVGGIYINGLFCVVLVYLKLNNCVVGFVGIFFISVGLGNVVMVFNSLIMMVGGLGYIIGNVCFNMVYMQVKLVLFSGVMFKQKNLDFGVVWCYVMFDIINVGYGFFKLEGVCWNIFSLFYVYEFFKCIQWYVQVVYQCVGGDVCFVVMNGIGVFGVIGVFGGQG